MGRPKKGYAERYKGESSLRKVGSDKEKKIKRLETKYKNLRRRRNANAKAAAEKKGEEKGFSIAIIKAEKENAKSLEKLTAKKKRSALKKAKKKQAKKARKAGCNTLPTVLDSTEAVLICTPEKRRKNYLTK